MNTYSRMLICLAAIAVLAAPSCATPTPFVIGGWVIYENGTACDDPAVNITNLNTSAEWQADTIGGDNRYHIMLTSGIDLNVGEVLLFDTTDEMNSNTTEHTITTGDVYDGGLFNFNLTVISLSLGDVNSDGSITSADALIALQMAVNGEYSKVADVSGDDSVTSLDVLMVMQAATDSIIID